MARPMPRPAPVTTATLDASSPEEPGIPSPAAAGEGGVRAPRSPGVLLLMVSLAERGNHRRGFLRRPNRLGFGFRQRSPHHTAENLARAYFDEAPAAKIPHGTQRVHPANRLGDLQA